MADYEHLCLGCMEHKGEDSICPNCGWKTGSPAEAPQHLPPGTIIQDKYLLGRVLGHGGFGITYIAWDLNLDMKLAIKEYMPRDFVTRAPEQTMVSVFSGEFKTHFENGLKSFLDEARTLAQFNNHPGIVGVRDFFRENGTAYLVMYYLEGIDFKQYLESQGGKVPFQTALMIMIPVMDALREVHRSGILHRDISPDNIYITSEGQVKVLDFGAARNKISEFSKSISVILKPGFAPEEQYRSKGNQGPWTDVYATAATFYRALVGHIPPESLDRLAEDTLIPPSQLGIDIPKQAEASLLKALSIKASNRYQSMEEFQQDLLHNMTVDDGVVQIEEKQSKELNLIEQSVSEPEKKKSSKWLWIGGGTAVCAFLTAGILGVIFLVHSIADNEPKKPVKNTPIVVTTSTDPDEKIEPPEKIIKEVTVPDVINIQEAEAKSLLQKEGLQLGEITYVESLYANKGVVTKQSLAADEKAQENDKIDLEISKGIELPFDEESIKTQHLEIVYEYWDKGYELNQKKDYTGALKLYIQARDMATVLYNVDGNFDAQYAIGVLNRNASLMKRTLGYFEYALDDIENSVNILEDLLTKDPVFQKDYKELANSYGDLSYIQFLNQLAKEAVVSAEKAIELNPSIIVYKVNLAHAYLFSDQYDQALELYTKHKNEPITDQQTFQTFVLADFNYFRQMKIIHPDMEKIEELYANSTTEEPSDEEAIKQTITANAVASEKEDVTGYMNTLDPNAVGYEDSKRLVEEVFAAYENIKIEIESMEVIEIKEQTAKVRVVQTLFYTEGTENYESKTTTIHNMVRSDGLFKWLISTSHLEGG